MAKRVDIKEYTKLLKENGFSRRDSNKVEGILSKNGARRFINDDQVLALLDEGGIPVKKRDRAAQTLDQYVDTKQPKPRRAGPPTTLRKVLSCTFIASVATLGYAIEQTSASKGKSKPRIDDSWKSAITEPRENIATPEETEIHKSVPPQPSPQQFEPDTPFEGKVSKKVFFTQVPDINAVPAGIDRMIPPGNMKLFNEVMACFDACAEARDTDNNYAAEKAFMDGVFAMVTENEGFEAKSYNDNSFRSVGYGYNTEAGVDKNTSQKEQGRVIAINRDRWNVFFADYTEIQHTQGNTGYKPPDYDQVRTGTAKTKEQIEKEEKEIAEGKHAPSKTRNGITITKDEAKFLTVVKLEEKLPLLRNAIGREFFDSLSPNQQGVLLNLYYQTPALIGKTMKKCADAGDLEGIAHDISEGCNGKAVPGIQYRQNFNLAVFKNDPNATITPEGFINMIEGKSGFLATASEPNVVIQIVGGWPEALSIDDFNPGKPIYGKATHIKILDSEGLGFEIKDGKVKAIDTREPWQTRMAQEKQGQTPTRRG